MARSLCSLLICFEDLAQFSWISDPPFCPTSILAGTTSIYDAPGGFLLAKESLFCFEDTAILRLSLGPTSKTKKAQLCDLKHKVCLCPACMVFMDRQVFLDSTTPIPLSPVLDFYLPVLLGQLSLKATLIITVFSNMPQCLDRSNDQFQRGWWIDSHPPLWWDFKDEATPLWSTATIGRTRSLTQQI